jgi:hypothetical protein
MTLSSELKKDLSVIHHLNPQIDSLEIVNNELTIVKQRSCVQRILWNFLHLITFGIVSKNPELEAVCKRCLEEYTKVDFEKGISRDERALLLHGFRVLKLIVENENDRLSNKITQILSESEKLKIVTLPILKPDNNPAKTLLTTNTPVKVLKKTESIETLTVNEVKVESQDVVLRKRIAKQLNIPEKLVEANPESYTISRSDFLETRSDMDGLTGYIFNRRLEPNFIEDFFSYFVAEPCNLNIQRQFLESISSEIFYLLPFKSKPEVITKLETIINAVAPKTVVTTFKAARAKENILNSKYYMAIKDLKNDQAVEVFLKGPIKDLFNFELVIKYLLQEDQESLVAFINWIYNLDPMSEVLEQITNFTFSLNSEEFGKFIPPFSENILYVFMANATIPANHLLEVFLAFPKEQAYAFITGNLEDILREAQKKKPKFPLEKLLKFIEDPQDIQELTDFYRLEPLNWKTELELINEHFKKVLEELNKKSIMV